MAYSISQHIMQAAITVNPGGGISAPGFSTATPSQVFVTIANTIIFLTGAIAVIMLIIGGLRYVISAGNSGSVAKAKDTIIYALVGLIAAAMAFAAVSFVAASFK